MAVLGNLEVTISSQGNTLQEYYVDPGAVANILSGSSTQQAATVIKYIEATPKAEFQITYKTIGELDFGKADYIVFRTFVDGQRLTSPCVEQKDLDKQGYYACSRSGAVRCDEVVSKLHPFCWKELSITDETSTTSPAVDPKNHAQIGTIKVQCNRKRTTSYRGKRTLPYMPLSNEPVPEKALKGRAVDVGTENVRTGECVDNEPLAEFIFLYRSKHALQILEVLPRTPPPLPLEDRATNSLTLEEATTMLDRQKVQSRHFFSGPMAGIELKAELEAARLAIERLEAQKLKLEENLGALRRSVAAIVAFPQGDYEEDGNANSIVKREAPDRANPRESLSTTEPPRKRVKHEPEVIDLSD